MAKRVTNSLAISKLEEDVKNQERELKAIKRALENGNIEALNQLKLKDSKSIKTSVKIPKILSAKEKERRDEIRRLKEVENLAKIQEKLLRQIHGRKKIEPINKKILATCSNHQNYDKEDVFASNLDKECQKILSNKKSDKEKNIKISKTKPQVSYCVSETNQSNDTKKHQNTINTNKSVLNSKIQINCENYDEIKDKEYLDVLDDEIKQFYLQKTGEIFNFLKDINLCRYIDFFLREGYDIYEEFLELNEEFFKKMARPFLNNEQQKKLFNKINEVKNKILPKKKIKIVDKININKNNSITSDENRLNTNSTDINEKNNLNNNNNDYKKVNSDNIIKDTSSTIKKEEFLIDENLNLEELEKQRSDDFKKAVEEWRNNNRPISAKINNNNAELGSNTLKEDNETAVCWNCLLKFYKNKGFKKEINVTDKTEKYKIKYFCSEKCMKAFEHKLKCQIVCFACKKTFDMNQGFIKFDEYKFCSSKCKNDYIEMKKKLDNKKGDEKNEIIIENGNKDNDNEIELENYEEEDNYDPMNDF